GDGVDLSRSALQAGQAQIDRLRGEARAREERKSSGEVAFDLYQTYGFPVELTEEVLRDQGFERDRAGFDAALGAERERARSAARFVRARDPAGSEFGDQPQTEFLAW